MHLLVKFLLVVLLSSGLYSASRCKNYIQRVKLAHFSTFGIDYPYWYGIGQLQQESRCRNVLSNDGIGSEGLPQITYKVWGKYLQKKGIPNILTVKNQLNAQAIIMADCKKTAYSSHLWVAYQIYNGGPLVNKEIKRARLKYNIREVPQFLAREFCKRRIIHFNNGQSIDACDINYEYSEKVYKYGLKYRIFDSAKYIFW